jgi:hypothetical protein
MGGKSAAAVIYQMSELKSISIPVVKLRPIFSLKETKSPEDKAPLALAVAVGIFIVIVVLDELTAMLEPEVPTAIVKAPDKELIVGIDDAKVIEPAPFVTVTPEPAVIVAAAKPEPLPINICPFVGVADKPVPPFETGLIPVVSAEAKLIAPVVKEVVSFLSIPLVKPPIPSRKASSAVVTVLLGTIAPALDTITLSLTSAVELLVPPFAIGITGKSFVTILLKTGTPFVPSGAAKTLLAV